MPKPSASEELSNKETMSISKKSIKSLDSAKLAKELRIHPKSKQTLDIILNDKKISHTQAYLDTHKTTNRHAANVNAAKLLAKPSVKIYMDRHVEMAKVVMVEIAASGNKDSDRIKAAQDILDRNEGKAIQKVQKQITSVNVNVEASEELNKDFQEFLKRKTAI